MNKRLLILIVIVVAVILGIAFWAFGSRFFQGSKDDGPVTLNFWTLWEDEEIFRTAIAEYKKTHPNVNIVFNHQSSLNYYSRVQVQSAASEGPDIFMVHNTWVPVFLKANLLAQTPASIMTTEEYGKTFYPVAKDSFIVAGKIYSIPLMVDGLALYYNEELLRNGGESVVPDNWFDLLTSAVNLTVRDDKGNIKTAGAALGETGNVDHWSDILGLLFLQQKDRNPQANLETPNTSAGAQVLTFYTNFVLNPEYKVWDKTMPNSTQAFAQGRVAYYFAPSWRAHELRQLNPQLKFKTAPVPQLPCAAGKQCGKIGWGSFWGYSVSAKSVKQKQAWEFLKFLSSQEGEKLIYQEASKIRLFGEPYSRMDLQQELIGDPVVGAFVEQGPYYKHWYLASDTHDKGGMNFDIIKAYEDAINSVLSGRDPQGALGTTASNVKQVLDRLNAPAAATE